MKTILTTLSIFALPIVAFAHGGHPEAVDTTTHSLLHLAPAAALIALTLTAVTVFKSRHRPAKAAR